MQFATLVDNSHFLFIVGDNFDEVTHDVRKESHTTKHDHNGEDSFVVGNGEIVSISNRTQRR